MIPSSAGSSGVPGCRTRAQLWHRMGQTAAGLAAGISLILPPLTRPVAVSTSLSAVAGPAVAQDTSGGKVVIPMPLLVLGGLALVVIGWRLSKALWPQVTSPDDVESSTGLVVLGTVPRRDVGRPRQGMAGPPTTADSMERICRLLEHNGLGAGISVITIVPAFHSAPSAFAVDLARALTLHGHDVLLILADMRQSLTKAPVPDPSKGLATLLQDDASDPVPLLVSVAEHLLVLPPGIPDEDPARLLEKPVLHDVIASLRHLGVIVIISAPPPSYTRDILALAHLADTTLLVVRSGSRWKEVQEAADTLRYGNVGDPAAVLVGVRRWASLTVGFPPRLRAGPGRVV